MPRLLTLSRAARLVGVRRGALQARIKNGELATFEGMVSVEDLLRAYPQARLEDNSVLERLEGIKEAAFARRLRERVLPSPEVLLARLAEMSRELAQTRARLDYYRRIAERLQPKLAEPGAEGAELLPLLAQDSFLRVMTAHVRIEPSGHEFFVEGSDSLLEAALRAGLSLDYGCSIGSCGRCKARVLSGEVLRTRHSDYALTEAEKRAGVVLMCCHTAVGDLTIEAREAHGAADLPLQRIEARVKSVSALGEDMRLLHLQTPRTQRLRFLAGQSVRLALPGGSAASCPVASCPCDDRNLHFHVRRRAGDAFAERVFGALKGADAVIVEGPRGDFVLDEESHRPLVFIAYETGFAPIKSLIEHAMALDVAETLHLIWVASGAPGHYLDNLCRAWSDALDNFRYTPVDELAPALQGEPRLPDCDVYLAGPAPWASAAERLLLEQGLPRAQLRVHAPEP